MSSAAATVAVAFAKAGAPYLVEKLKAGELGPVGESVGNFIGPFVLDGNSAKLDEIKEEIAGLKLGIEDVRGKLDSVATLVTQAQYSNAALEASCVLGSIDKAQKELNNLALATTENDRNVHAEHLWAQLGPGGDLFSAQEILQKQLTTPAPGADGILIAANKAAKGRANPFFTRSLALSQGEVYRYYSMNSALLLALRVNYWHHKGLDGTTIEREIRAFDGEQAAQRALLKWVPYPNTAVDTRTGLTWADSFDGAQQILYTWTPPQPNPRIASYAMQARQLPSGRWIVQCNATSCPYAYGGIWDVPTIAQLQTLARDHGPPSFTTFLDQNADFSPFSVPLQWAAPNPGASTPQVYNVNTGDVGSISPTSTAGWIGVSPAGVELAGLYYY